MLKILIIIIILGLVFLGIFWFYKDKNETEVLNIQRSQNLALKMKISSPNFSNNEFIPSEFSCEGKDINPELYIEDVPKEAKSLVLIVDDPDAPMGTWTHWTLWNISPDTKVIKSGEVPQGAVEGKTDFGRPGWGGPCPPKGNAHKYFFKLFALDTLLDLKQGASHKDLEKAMEGHILDKAELIGLYQRK